MFKKLHTRFVNSRLWFYLYYKHSKQHKADLQRVHDNATTWRRASSTYHCDSCSKLGNKKCVKDCELIERDDEVLAKLVAKTHACPDCGKKDSLRGGPEGGAAQNVLCINCNHWFNFCLGQFMHRIIK